MRVIYSKYTPKDVEDFIGYEANQMGSKNLAYIKRREAFIKWLPRCVTVLYVMFLYVFTQRVQYLVLPTCILMVSVFCYMKIYMYCKQKSKYGLHISTVAEMNKRKVRISPIITDYFRQQFSDFLEVYRLQTYIKENALQQFVGLVRGGLIVKVAGQEDEVMLRISVATAKMIFIDDDTVDLSAMDSEFEGYFEVMNFEKNILKNE